MERISASPNEGRRGAVPCDEKDCKFTFIKTRRGTEIVNSPSEAHCLLQLRLRARGAANVDPCRYPRDEIRRTTYVEGVSLYEWESRDGFIRHYEEFKADDRRRKD